MFSLYFHQFHCILKFSPISFFLHVFTNLIYLHVFTFTIQVRCSAGPSGVKIEKDKFTNNLNLTAAISFNSESESDIDGDDDGDAYSIRVEDIYKKNIKSNLHGDGVPSPISYTDKPSSALPSVPILTPSLTSSETRVTTSSHKKSSWDSLNGQRNHFVPQTLPKGFVFAQPTNFPSRETKK